MFEILAGDLFDVEGELLTVSRLRIAVVGGEVRAFVHYSHRGGAKIGPAPEFARWLAGELEAGRARNLNREADFAHV